MKRHVMKLVSAALTLAAVLSVCAGSAEAAPKDEKWAKTAQKIAAATGTECVKTIQWSAKLSVGVKNAVVVRNTKDPSDPLIGQKIKIKKNTKVTLIQRDYHERAGVSQCMLKDGKEVYIPNRYLKSLKPKATGKQGDYSKETKLAFVNNQNISSGDRYMIWVSLDKQRVNVFEGSNHHWNLLYVWKTSTGAADAPTLDQSFKSNYIIQWKKEEVNGLYWYNAVYGSGMHKFPGGGMNKVLGIKPVSHSCIRLKVKNAKWVYNNTTDAKSGGKSHATRVFIW